MDFRNPEGRGVVLGILGLALGLRLIAAWFGPEQAASDAIFYEYHAKSLLSGRGYANMDGSPAIKWMPGWAMTIAALFAVFGKKLSVVYWANALWGTAAVGLLMYLGRQLFDRRIGNMAGLLYAVWPGILYFTGIAMTEVFFGLLSILYLCLLHHFGQLDPARHWRGYVAIGMAFTAALFVRVEILMFLPATALWLLMIHGWSDRMARATSILVVSVVVLMVPWTVRNYQAFGRIIPTSANSWIALAHANHPDSNGRHDFRIMMDLRAKHDAGSFSETTIALNDAGLGEVVSFVREQPGDWLALLPKQFWGSYGGDNWAARIAWGTPFFGDARAPLWIYRIGNYYWYGILSLAALGLLTVPRWRMDARVLVLTGYGTFFLLKFIILGSQRYHFYETPFLALMAAWGIVWIAEKLRLPLRL